jgi:hypothetical protein
LHRLLDDYSVITSSIIDRLSINMYAPIFDAISLNLLIPVSPYHPVHHATSMILSQTPGGYVTRIPWPQIPKVAEFSADFNFGPCFGDLLPSRTELNYAHKLYGLTPARLSQSEIWSD